MPIEYPWFFFRLMRPRNVSDKLEAALNDPATLQAVGVKDPRMLVEYVRDNTDDDDVWMAACKLFPLPGQQELFGFRFQAEPVHMGYITTPLGIIDLGLPAVNMVNDAGALTWVRTYRKMVQDWCAEHRAARTGETTVNTPTVNGA